MKIILLFFVFSLQYCTVNKCSETEINLQLRNVISEEKEMFEKSGERDFKFNLLNKICSIIKGNNKILIVEQIDVFSGSRKGLIYIYDKNSLFFFLSGKGNFLKIGEGTNNYIELNSILLKVRDDFIGEGVKIKSQFENMQLHDAPILQLIQIDLAKGNSILEFPFYAGKILGK